MCFELYNMYMIEHKAVCCKCKYVVPFVVFVSELNSLATIDFAGIRQAAHTHLNRKQRWLHISLRATMCFVR